MSGFIVNYFAIDGMMASFLLMVGFVQRYVIKWGCKINFIYFWANFDNSFLKLFFLDTFQDFQLLIEFLIRFEIMIFLLLFVFFKLEHSWFLQILKIVIIIKNLHFLHGICLRNLIGVFPLIPILYLFGSFLLKFGFSLLDGRLVFIFSFLRIFGDEFKVFSHVVLVPFETPCPIGVSHILP